MHTGSIDPLWAVLLVGLSFALLAVLVWYFAGGKRAGITVIQIDRITYALLVRSIDKRGRRRYGRMVGLSTGSYGVHQASRTCNAASTYGVLDEVQELGLLDLDSQQARVSLDSLPTVVSAVALYPRTERVHGNHRVELASASGFGLGHKSLIEVQRMRQEWQPPLQDFLHQITLQLHHAHMPAPPLLVIFFSPGGHALVGLEAIQRLRELYSHDSNAILCGVTVVPEDSGRRREFADLIQRVVETHALDFLLLTENRAGPDAQHDDMVAHLLAANLQAARPSGANPANVMADATIPAQPSPTTDGEVVTAPRRTRILTFEFVEERIAVEPAARPGLLERLLGARPGVPHTSPQVLVHRGDEVATRLANGNGKLAGPLPLATDTRTALILGLPSNDAARFAEIAAMVRTRFDAREIKDQQRVHFLITQLAVPETPEDKGVPLVGIRLGEMRGPLSELLQALHSQAALPDSVTPRRPLQAAAPRHSADGNTSVPSTTAYRME